MKVLMVNKYHYVRGGSERYMFDLSELLRAHGHTVGHLSTHDNRNAAGRDDAPLFAIDGVDFDVDQGAIGSLRTAARVIYSRAARRAVRDAVERFRPDVAHLHNIAHHFSPSILLEFARLGVPVVQTLHDFKLVCPTYRLLSGSEICERCSGGRFHHVVSQRCNRGSLVRSAVNAVESYLHAWLGSYDRVDRFHCPSRFLRDKVASFGVGEARLVHLPLFIDPRTTEPRPEPGDYAIFVGRLSPEKGVSTLLEAARSVPELALVIVGDGPDRRALESMIEAGGLDHVRLAGRLEGEALMATWRAAAFTIVPSEWYENFPLSVVESMALGKPVLASRLGGLAEMVTDGVTGRLIEHGSPDALADAMRTLGRDRDVLGEMGRAARRHVEDHWTPERHLAGMMNIYEAVGARQAVDS